MKAELIAQRNISRAIERAKEMIFSELRAQGHRASGKTEKRTKIVIKGKLHTGIEASIYMPDHVNVLDKGVKPSRVPFSLGSGAGKSKYIDALIRWIKIIKPSMNKKERKSFAFAIAKTAKKEGHPTRGSYEFTDNGRRKNWSKNAITGTEVEGLLNIDEIGEAVLNEFASGFDELAKI